MNNRRVFAGSHRFHALLLLTPSGHKIFDYRSAIERISFYYMCITPMYYFKSFVELSQLC